MKESGRKLRKISNIMKGKTKTKTNNMRKEQNAVLSDEKKKKNIKERKELREKENRGKTE